MAQIPELFQLKVYNETGVLFEDSVVAISAENDTGPLSILSGHTNFISTINGSITEEKLIVYLPDGSTKGFLLESGVIKVFENLVEVFLVLDLNLGLSVPEQAEQV